jgi:hypothetical protein
VGLTGAGAEVGDPFGSDLQVYRATCAQLEELIAGAVKRLRTERGDAVDRE